MSAAIGLVRKKKITKVPLTKAQRAVAVAKDIIKQLKLEKLNLAHAYCEGTFDTPLSPDADAQKHIGTIQKVCRVCAIGAAFLSHIRLYDDMRIADLQLPLYEGAELNHPNYIGVEREQIVRKLRGTFTARQLDMIEDAYETSYCGLRDAHTKSEKFGVQFGTSNEKLTAICKNIIKNDGVFKP